MNPTDEIGKTKRKDSGRLWIVARATTGKLKKDESGNLHWTADHNRSFPVQVLKRCAGERRKRT